MEAQNYEKKREDLVSAFKRKLEKMPNQLVEALADIEHDRWSSWMRYMFSKGQFNNDDGTWTMPAWAVERWQGQANTKYAALSEKEKDSDRAEVDKTLRAISEYLLSITSPGEG